MNKTTIEEMLDRYKLIGTKPKFEEEEVYTEYRFIADGTPYRMDVPVLYERFKTREDLDKFLTSNRPQSGFIPVKVTYTTIE